jgi:hypothetical protein
MLRHLPPLAKHKSKVAWNETLHGVNLRQPVTPLPHVHCATEGNGACIGLSQPSGEQDSFFQASRCLFHHRRQGAVDSDPKGHYRMVTDTRHTRPLATKTKQEHNEGRFGARQEGDLWDTTIADMILIGSVVSEDNNVPEIMPLGS